MVTKPLTNRWKQLSNPGITTRNIRLRKTAQLIDRKAKNLSSNIRGDNYISLSDSGAEGTKI